MRELFKRLENCLRDGYDAVLVTVVAGSGSVPRGAGARMLVTKDGRLRGTIGGGAVEYHSEQLARELLDKKSSHIERYRLKKNQVLDLGMVCGGDVTVYFQYIPAGDTKMIALAERIEALFSSGQESWLISGIDAGSVCEMAVYGEKDGVLGMEIPETIIDNLSSGPVQISAGGHTYYCEKLINAGIVYIFGGGHVAQALVPALSAVGFRCVILEDREDFCKKELFSGVEKTLLIDNSRICDFISIGDSDYVVIMTRGHENDRTVLSQALRTPAYYIGLIGSAGKKASIFSHLRSEGFADEDLERITTPIGLAIKADTPAEIAVSITAQLILKRAERTGN